MSQENNKVMNEIKELVCQQALCSIDSLSSGTRLGEDLRLVGDDAEEFLSAFADKFNVDLSSMKFNDYFPDEATSDMHYYLSAIANHRRNNALIRFIKALESNFWKIFASKKTFESVTLEDLLHAVENGKWKL